MATPAGSTTINRSAAHCAVAALLLAMLTHAASAGPVYGQGTWESTLLARDVDRNGVVDGYYDTSLNVTWMSDWNTTSVQTWYVATAWAENLSLFGVTGWRLPATTDVGHDGCNFTYGGHTDCGYNVDPTTSELAHMFYVTLGNKAYCPPDSIGCTPSPQEGSGLTNTAKFRNIQNNVYFSGTEDTVSPDLAWVLYMDGNQNVYYKSAQLNIVAVHDGDVFTVSAPCASALLGALLVPLVRRRKCPHTPNVNGRA